MSSSRRKVAPKGGVESSRVAGHALSSSSGLAGRRKVRPLATNTSAASDQSEASSKSRASTSSKRSSKGLKYRVSDGSPKGPSPAHLARLGEGHGGERPSSRGGGGRRGMTLKEALHAVDDRHRHRAGDGSPGAASGGMRSTKSMRVSDTGGSRTPAGMRTVQSMRHTRGKMSGGARRSWASSRDHHHGASKTPTGSRRSASPRRSDSHVYGKGSAESKKHVGPGGLAKRRSKEKDRRDSDRTHAIMSRVPAAESGECCLCVQIVQRKWFFTMGGFDSPSQLGKLFIFVGDREDSRDKQRLIKLGVTHILNTAEQLPNPYPKDFLYLKLNITDSKQFDITRFFERAFDFLDDCRVRGGRCLVHCVGGVSRSVTVSVAYMMARMKMRLDRALNITLYYRPIICPNEGFLIALAKYELTLYGESTVVDHEMYKKLPRWSSMKTNFPKSSKKSKSGCCGP